MLYKELKEIAKKKLPYSTDRVPQNALYTASLLHLRLRNSTECKEDFGEDYPLIQYDACYVLYKGEYTIYYDEHNPYKNFSVAHEIAHHLLGHTSDGVVQHHDAQLMAAIIIAPSEYIFNIKSATELADKCGIPIEVAENYWYEMEQNGEINSKKINQTLSQKIQFSTFSRICVWAILALSAWIAVQQFTFNQEIIKLIHTTPPFPNNTIEISEPISIDGETVFISPSNDKFHRKDCPLITDSEHLLPLPINKVIQAGYKPCEECIR